MERPCTLPTMKSRVRTWVAAIGGMALAAGCFGQINGSVITEVTRAGRDGPRPSPGRPVYFLAHDGGETDLGLPIAGQEAPHADILGSALVHALRVSGYRPADAAHPASIFIDYRWGYFNRDLRGYPPAERINFVEHAALVGGNAFAQRVLDAMNARTLDIFRNSGSKTVLLMQDVESDLYFLVASAYDYPAARQGRTVLLWRTKMSTVARGETMSGSLPVLVRAAGPYFGKEMSEAAWIEAQPPAGAVEVGTPTVTGEVSAPLPSGFTPDKNDVETFPKDRIGLPPF